MVVNTPIFAPSLLASNHANLSKGLSYVEKSGCQWIHLDIMDGHFVPNLSFGPQTVKDLRKGSSIFFDTHLMMNNPHHYIDAFADAGSDLISIHVEPDYPIVSTLKKIQKIGLKNGIVLNPKTPVESVEPYLEIVDLVLIMTVQPGFGGQKFQPAMSAKMQQLNRWRNEKKLSFRIEVDGGISEDNLSICLEKGVDTIVAGTAFYKHPEPNSFRKLIEETI